MKDKIKYFLPLIAIALFSFVPKVFAANDTVNILYASRNGNTTTITWRYLDNSAQYLGGNVVAIYPVFTTSQTGTPPKPNSGYTSALNKNINGNSSYLDTTWGSTTLCNAANDSPSTYTIGNIYTTTIASSGISFYLAAVNSDGVCNFDAQTPVWIDTTSYPVFNQPLSETTDSIVITFPTSTTPTSAYFNNWDLTIHYATTTWATSSPFYTAIIFNSATSTNLNTNIFSDLTSKNLKGGVMNVDCDYAQCVNGTSYLSIPNYMTIKASSTFYARGALLYGTNLVALSPIYTYNSNSLTPEETAWNPLYGYEATSTTITNKCTWSVDPSNWVNCISVGIENIISFLVMPHDLSLLPLNNAINGFKDIFPFKIFFRFNEIVQSQISGFSSTSIMYFPIVMPNGASSTIPILTSSSVASVIGTQAKTVWFDFQKWITWIAVIWLSVKMMIHKKK